MFSAIKKWAKGNEDSKGSMPLGVKSMGQALQRKFARGIQYNMKIVIKGDRNTGKSCLFHRLQGKPFTEQYLPTSEIQVASIHWSYRAADDIVKVEVWDVVDRGKSKKKREGLKMDNADNEDESKKDDTVLDAEFLDVYKGTHGVIMLLDITKPWTFQYVERELPKVPPHLPVLLLANYRDMHEHRLVQADEIQAFAEHLERPDRSPPVHYGEASMKNGFGLKYIHRFLNMPYLLLQRETLLQQLQVNAMDTESTLEEMLIQKESEEQDFDKFVSMLDKRRKAHETAKAATQGQAAQPATANSPNPPDKTAGLTTPSAAASPPPADPGSAGSLRERFSKKLFSSKDQDSHQVEEVIPRRSAGMGPSDVDEFVPEDQLDAQFLNDEGSAKPPPKTNRGKSKSHAPARASSSSSEESEDSDSDTNSKNPMVAGFAEDIESEDEVNTSHARSTEHAPNHVGAGAGLNGKSTTNQNVELTSSEEDADEEEDGKGGEKDTKREEKRSGSSHAADHHLMDDFGFGNDEVNSWLNSPDKDVPGAFSFSNTDKDYQVRKVNKNQESQPAKAANINLDDWEVFMKQQLQPSTSKPTTPKRDDVSNHDRDSDEDDQESKSRKKKENKSGEKSRSKHKHRKHKEREGDKEDEEGKSKERRKSKHKDGDSERERRKSREEEATDKKKKHRHKHSKKKTSGAEEGRVYEAL